LAVFDILYRGEVGLAPLEMLLAIPVYFGNATFYDASSSLPAYVNGVRGNGISRWDKTGTSEEREREVIGMIKPSSFGGRAQPDKVATSAAAACKDDNRDLSPLSLSLSLSFSFSLSPSAFSLPFTPPISRYLSL
jgi:hypothetical protein